MSSTGKHYCSTLQVNKVLLHTLSDLSVQEKKKKEKILRETLTFIIYYLQRKKQPEPQRLYLLVYTPPAYKVAEWKF